MAANVQFIRKDSADKNPDTLVAVDAAICEHFGAVCDPVDWYEDWYCFVGLMYAIDKRGDEVIEAIAESFESYPERKATLTAVATFIESVYDISSWTSTGKW